jgi:uncharacterized protein
MTAADNIALARAMYDAQVRGDAKAALAALHTDVVLREPESLPYGGAYVGLESVLAGIGEAARWVDLSSLQVERILGDEEVVVAFIRCDWRKEDGSRTALELRECLTIRDGKVAEIQVFLWDTAALVAAAP